MNKKEKSHFAIHRRHFCQGVRCFRSQKKGFPRGYATGKSLLLITFSYLTAAVQKDPADRFAVFRCLLSLVDLDQLLQVFETLLALLLGSCEEFLRAVRICAHKRCITNFACQEVLIGLCRSLGIETERSLSFLCEIRVEAEVEPVAGLYSELFLCDGLAHALADTVVDTRSPCGYRG